MPHYMMDFFYEDPKGVDGFRRDSFVIKVGSDNSAITEAKALAATYEPKSFRVRYITRATDREGGTCIYDSEKGD